MRETRRTLKAENQQLRDQLAVHNHATRASLHDFLKGVIARNEDLAKTCHDQANKLAEMDQRLKSAEKVVNDVLAEKKSA